MDTREPSWPDSADLWARCRAAEAKVARVQMAARQTVLEIPQGAGTLDPAGAYRRGYLAALMTIRKALGGAA